MRRETVGDEVRSGDLTVEGSVSFAGGTDLSTALAGKADLASPALTGTPTAPTATAGQLFSVADGLSGTIFSVNDISGIPSIEVLDDGTVKLAEYGGAVTFGAQIDTNKTLYFNTSSLGTFDPPGTGGSDTATDAAVAITSGSRIVGINDGYIRTLLKWTSSADIEIGQAGASLIGGINLLPGASGVAKVNGNTIWHAGNDGSGSGLDADLLDGQQASSFASLSGATFTGNVTGVSPTAAGSWGYRRITMSTSAPSGGLDGDVWLVYT